MHTQTLLSYVNQARKNNKSNEAIKNALIAAGWPDQQVQAALHTDPDMPEPPVPPTGQSFAIDQQSNSGKPVAVVHTLTPRGTEYLLLFIAMGVAATSLAFILHEIANQLFGQSGNGTFSSASAALLVSLPIFSVLFIRLKRAELRTPVLYTDPSRKRAVQLTLLVTFLIGIFNLIWYVYNLLNTTVGVGSSNYAAPTNSPGLDLLHTAITLTVAGGIFAYYWRDLHKADGK